MCIPEQPLSVFDDTPAQGTWILLVVDDAVTDTGRLLDWQLQFEINQPCHLLFADGFESADVNAWTSSAE